MLPTHVIILPISSRITTLALRQSVGCPSASDATLKDIGNLSLYLTTTKHNEMAAVCKILESTVNREKWQFPIIVIIFDKKLFRILKFNRYVIKDKH